MHFTIICLFALLTLTGCALFGEIHGTKPIDVSDLAKKHIYKKPKKSNTACHLTRFNDPQLQQLIFVALADAPDMRSARARVYRANQVAMGAYSSLWPSVDLSGYLQTAYFPLHGTIPFPLNQIRVNKVNIADIALKLNYEFDFWGKNRATLAARLSETFAAEMDLAETRLVISAAVATAYFELQNNIAQQKLAAENVRILKTLSDIIVDREKQGIESNIPVKTAISNTESAILSLEDYKRAEQQSRHQLAVLLGKNPLNTQIQVTAFTYNKKLLALPAVIPANILALRPDIASARALAEASAQRIHVAKTAFFPNFNLKGLSSIQKLYFSNAFNIWFPNESATAALDLPLFDAGARLANLRVNYADYELAVNEYNQTILNSLQQVADQLSALKSLNAQVKAQTKALNTTKSNYKLFWSRYTQGVIDYTQLIEIQQLLVQEKATLRTLQTRQVQAVVALLTAIGSEV